MPQPGQSSYNGRFYNYLQSAVKLMQSYTKGSPLAIHLKQCFAANRKHGSRDRKLISNLCYQYCRVSGLFEGTAIDQSHFIEAHFLCEEQHSDLLQAVKPEWNVQVSLTVSEKLSIIGKDAQNLFPFAASIGGLSNKELFMASLLKQPSVFLRARPHKAALVANKLLEAGVTFETEGANCFRLPAAIDVDEVLKLNRDAVVQDASSQQVFDFLLNDASFNKNKTYSVWDACAASGGKSILVNDILDGRIKLTVSDIRENILANCKSRLQQAGIPLYSCFTANLEKGKPVDVREKFDIIIADVPCSGSGTWARTPEQLYSFEQSGIDSFATKQQAIVSNLVPHLQREGYFIYITCSVFRKENEDNVGFLQDKFQLQLLQMKYFEGFENRADVLFVAVLRST